MAQPMHTDNQLLKFPWGPIQIECDVHELIVEGEIHSDLCGTLYRNGPNQRFRPRGDYHLFAGDGMVHAFHIKDGKVDYRNRWVRTAKWNIEDKEGRAVINAMNPFDCEPEYSDFVLVDKEGLANTALVWHAGRLLAMEEGHPPYELDPHTLDSIGTWTFRGKLHTAMTAHPKVDPKTGEMLLFAYMATGPFAADVMVHKVNPEGILAESILLPTPYSSMVHDFVITENFGSNAQLAFGNLARDVGELLERVNHAAAEEKTEREGNEARHCADHEGSLLHDSHRGEGHGRRPFEEDAPSQVGDGRGGSEDRAHAGIERIGVGRCQGHGTGEEIAYQR